MELLGLSRYEYTKHVSPKGIPWHMDDIHVRMLYEVISVLPAGATLVEIGSCNGRSTVAFIQALKDDPTKILHIIEIKPTTSLRRLIRESGVDKRVILHDYPANESMPQAPDLVLIDGDHGVGAYVDLLACLLQGAGIIAMHDSQTAVTTDIPGCEVAHQVAGMLKSASQSRLYIEDTTKRPNAWTERGFLVSVPLDRWHSTGLVADTPWEALLEGVRLGWSKPNLVSP